MAKSGYKTAGKDNTPASLLDNILFNIEDKDTNWSAKEIADYIRSIRAEEVRSKDASLGPSKAVEEISRDMPSPPTKSLEDVFPAEFMPAPPEAYMPKMGAQEQKPAFTDESNQPLDTMRPQYAENKREGEDVLWKERYGKELEAKAKRVAGRKRMAINKNRQGNKKARTDADLLRELFEIE